jgi:hypothetical protein
MKIVKLVTTLGTLGIGLALAACGGGNGNVTLTPGPAPTGVPVATSTAQPSGTFTQIELLSRPAVKEVFEPFVDHQITNAAEPYSDPTLQKFIKATEDALRPPVTTGPNPTDYGATLQGILYPNEYEVDLTQTTGGFLGVESGGVYGGKFGGRNINDDVVALELSAAFGNGLTAIGVHDDGEENNCLSKQNTTIVASQASVPTFPYLNSPH